MPSYFIPNKFLKKYKIKAPTPQTPYPLRIIGTSFIPARAASQTVMRNAIVGSSPNSRLKLKFDTASFSPALDE